MVSFLGFMKINRFESFTIMRIYSTKFSSFKLVFLSYFFLWDLLICGCFQNEISWFIVDKRCKFFEMILGTTTTHNDFDDFDVSDIVFFTHTYSSKNDEYKWLEILGGNDSLLAILGLCWFYHFYHFAFGCYFYRTLFLYFECLMK